jgi:CTP:molybdopterin cytidylyltransferase MocA
MAASLEIGARQVVRAHARELVEIAVEDTGVVRGIDAPSDYDRFMPPRSTG